MSMYISAFVRTHSFMHLPQVLHKGWKQNWNKHGKQVQQYETKSKFNQSAQEKNN